MIDVALAENGGGAELQARKRRLMVRDGGTFAVLLLGTVCLFGVTLLLFKSFESHRADLAQRWAERGRAALAGGRPDAAVGAVRAALLYAPDDWETQLLLARALADAGHTDESENYFMNLREARPGDGLINLELARLARRQGRGAAADEFYRAAIFGAWAGDGSVRRREVRLELADTLTAQGKFAAARAELLTVAGNAPETAELDLALGDKFQAAQDTADALSFYMKAVALEPHDPKALEAAGRMAFALARYAEARDLLRRAQEDGVQNVGSMEHDAARLLELSMDRQLPGAERAAHIALAAKVAQERLSACASDAEAAGDVGLLALGARWHAADGGARRPVQAGTAAAQDEMEGLIFDTEAETARVCGAPAGDDALLLKLARAQSGAAHE